LVCVKNIDFLLTFIIIHDFRQRLLATKLHGLGHLVFVAVLHRVPLEVHIVEVVGEQFAGVQNLDDFGGTGTSHTFIFYQRIKIVAFSLEDVFVRIGITLGRCGCFIIVKAKTAFFALFVDVIEGAVRVEGVALQTLGILD
jgi:hypothetical protein